MSPPELELVAAVAANGVIGRQGDLPWHLPDDLKHFKTLTTGHTVIMGRRTYASIGRPLPNRRSIVITGTLRSADHPEVELAGSLDDALRLATEGAGRAFVIGGAELYRAALPLARTLHLTVLDEPVDGDTYFPHYDRDQWRVIDEARHDADARHAVGFWIRTYRRADA